MVYRAFNPSKSRSFFVFGARGSGKSTWLRSHFTDETTLYFNLLDPSLYETLLLSPNIFLDMISTKDNKLKSVVVDEIQRVPALLDIIHDQLSKSKRLFMLTGSSARRLKQKGINLLAGRASVYKMYPLSMAELANDFDLTTSLDRGLLPEPYLSKETIDAHEFLKAYVQMYIEKEIQQEQWVRKIEPFRKFLNIAAQMNTKIINKSKIAQQVGVESVTIESYYEILEDTLIGIRIPGFATSIRKQVKLADKFYFVDTGISRAIEKTLSIPMIEHTSYFGTLFENFIVMEIVKFIEYSRLEWTLSYLRTKEDVEIDLVISRPKNSPILIEVKSAKKILDADLKPLIQLGPDLDKLYKMQCPKILVSQDPLSRESIDIHIIHFRSLIHHLSSLK